jgi:hypothetical protein
MGGYPDAEEVVMDLLQPWLDRITPAGLACTYIPDDLRAHLPIVRIFRTGGGEDPDSRLDWSSIRLAVIGESRSDSWKVAEYCREAMFSYRDGGRVLRLDGSHTVVHSVAEMVGPQLLPELNPDVRMVPIMFRVEIKRPLHQPDYARIREDLQL